MGKGGIRPPDTGTVTMPRKTARVRLDQLVVDLGIAPDATKAQAMIIAGLVEVKSLSSPKPGDLLDPSEPVSVKKTNPYVSRGGMKLESAMKRFGVTCENKTCMDIGASTGGFTDYLLKHGAKKVYSVDVGRGLLDSTLLKDPRVENLEGVNFRYFSNQTLKEKIEFVTIDVSFISLEKILPKAVGLLGPGGCIVAMAKPQFEVHPRELKKGVVKDERARQAAIEKIKSFSIGLGLEILGQSDSEVKGPRGNIEHFLWMRKTNADQTA